MRENVPAETLSLMKRIFVALLLGALALVIGCDSPQRTVTSLRKEIAEFKAAPDDKRGAKIDQDFAKLERQIAELQQRGDPSADELRNQLVSLRSELPGGENLKGSSGCPGRHSRLWTGFERYRAKRRGSFQERRYKW